MNNSIINVNGVSKTYESAGGTESCNALNDVNLEFPRGTLTSLLGPSGCGKTTLLKIIAGLLEPTGGEVLISGRRVEGPGPERAFVFQDFALLPWTNTLRNVAFGLELRGVAKEQRYKIAKKYIDQVGLSGFEENYPDELSGGMRQRVGLARALAVDSDILLMDEPFASVDEQTRRKFQEDLLDLLKVEKKTVVFVTHSIEEAVYVSDRIVLLTPRPGTVMEIIEPNIDRDPNDPEAARRSEAYLDCVDRLWDILKKYVV
ncbi:MAG: ABC transporter ATP-binding protein [Deltaproteobacteria bacterium]|nr:ABC transporter ATP-binding protein [Deltaproteobacteria bacterium]